MHIHGLTLQAIFYRPVIRYTLGQIGFIKMTILMFFRFVLFAILMLVLLGWVAYDQGVFEQDGSRPDPGIAAAARQKAEADAYFAHHKRHN